TRVYEQWRRDGIAPAREFYETRQAMGSVARFIAALGGLAGPAYTLSTACSSSAKVFASARGLIDLGLCDAVVTGGVDSLCELTLNGFEALASLSRTVSNPMS